jgi:hypothetical protein
LASADAVAALAPYVTHILAALEQIAEMEPGDWSEGALVTDESRLSDFFDVTRDRSQDQALYAQLGQMLGIVLDHANENDRFVVRVALRLKRHAVA